MELDYEILVGPCQLRIFCDPKWFCWICCVPVLISRTETPQAAEGKEKCTFLLATAQTREKTSKNITEHTESIKHLTFPLSLYSHSNSKAHPAFPVNSNRKEQKQPEENGKIMKETQTTLSHAKSNPLALQAPRIELCTRVAH